MNKILKTSLLLGAVATLGMMNTNAKTMSASDIEKLSAIDNASYGNVYIMGKYVFVENISAADIMEASDDLATDQDYLKEYRQLFTSGMMNVIYKDYNNNWINATKASDSITSKSNISIEMTHLVADASDEGHISSDESLYSDGSYITDDTSVANRKVELFVDQKADLKVESVEKVRAIANLTAQFGSDYHKYNTSAIDVAYNNGIATVTEKSPLLQFYYKNNVANASWIALLVKTNKPVTNKDTVTLTGTSTALTINTDYAIELDSTNHGGAANEFVLWINTDKLNNSDEEYKLSVKDADATEAQEIKIKYPKNIKELFVAKDVKEASNEIPVVKTAENSGVSAIPVEVNGKYSIIFYKENGAAYTSDFDCYVDNVKYLAHYAGSSYSLIAYNQVIDNYSFKAAEAVSGNENSEWNQSAITQIEVIKTENKGETDPDYTVKIHINKGLKGNNGLSIDYDLVGTKGNEANLTAASDVVKTYNTPSNISNNAMKIRYVVVDDTEALEATFKKSAPANVYTDTTSYPAHAELNQKYINNVNYTNDLITEFDESTKTYTVTIKQTSMDAAKALTEVTADSYGTEKIPTMYIGVIVDFGIAYEDLSFNTTAMVSGNEMAKRIGATTDTAFVVWVSDTNSDITVSDSKNTNTTMTLKMVLNKLAEKPVYDMEDKASTSDITIASEYANVVEYRKGVGFILTTGMAVDTKSFVATKTETIDGKTVETEYTYIYDEDAEESSKPALVKIQNLKLNNVIPTVHNTGGYPTASIDKITFDKDTNTVNVVFKREPGTGKYGLVVDLGLGNVLSEGSKIGQNGGTAKDISPAGHLSTENANKILNYIVIWVDSSISSSEDGQKFSLVHEKNSKKSAPLNITVKSTVAERDDDLVLKSAENVKPDSNLLQGTVDADLVKNLLAYTTSIEDGKVIISYNKNLESFTTQGKLGILMDLGVKANYIDKESTSDVVIENTSATVTKYGGTSDSQFILWVTKTFDNSKEDLTFDVTFNQKNNEDNQYATPLKVTFVLRNNIDYLTLSENNISERDASLKATTVSVGGKEVKTYDDDVYVKNQNTFDYTFEMTADNAGTIKVKPTSASSIHGGTFKITNKTDDSTYETSGNDREWYAVSINLGRAINVVGANGSTRVDNVDIDNGILVLWINTQDGTKLSTLTLTDANNGTTYTLKVDISDVK